MSTNKKKRYNTSTKTKDWFPFPKYLFEATNHPILLSTDKCSSSIESLFCQQEVEQIKSITNSLQCSQRDAVRIALFEVIRAGQAAHEKSYEKAKSGSSVKGHEGRSSIKRIYLPKAEKAAAEQAAKQLGISIKEFLRLAVIWLADGIKEESITRLTCSKRIDEDEVAKRWSRENQGKPPSEQVASFKRARDETQALIDYLSELRQYRQHKRNEERSKLTWSQRQELDHAESEADQCWQDQFSLFYEELNFAEQFAWYFMQANEVDWDTALAFAEEDLVKDHKAKRMIAKQQLERIVEGKKKASVQNQELEKRLKALAMAELKEASAKWRQENPVMSIDLAQRKQDQAAVDEIRRDEDQKDLEAYLNDPILWDEDDRIRNPLQ